MQPLLSVFGGKITTHRKLAEAAMAKLAPYFPGMPPAWTATGSLPGGDFPWDGVGVLEDALRQRYPFLTEATVDRLVRAYGTLATAILGDARTIDDLGQHFGAGLTAREVTWLRDHEWARSAEDILWRRSKLGLRLSSQQASALTHWLLRPS
jgi:glycerol-3-phosphate dehydrogenase